RGRLLFDTGGANQEHERCRAAVHDRDFRRTDVHIGVIDAQSGHRGEQVLDGGDAHIALDQTGGQLRVADVLGARLNLDRLVQIHAAKDYARIHRGRPQRQVDFLASVQTHTRRADAVLKSPLSNHREEYPPYRHWYTIESAPEQPKRPWLRCDILL